MICARLTPLKSSLARGQSPAAAACCWDRKFLIAWHRCVTCQKALTSDLPVVIRTGPGLMIWKLKSLNCVKSLDGVCRSTSKWVVRVLILIPHWRSRPVPMLLCWTVCRAAPRQRRMCLSNMSDSPFWPVSARLCVPCKTSICTVKCN